jgi:hypothetical protein
VSATIRKVAILGHYSDGTRFSPASSSVTAAIWTVRVAAAWAVLVDDEVADEMW